ncbi:hypothetical protein GCM10009641_69790 [Mycobacterium cookii]|uniref:Bacterial type II secretion system protein E domain-containing protein n=1 Tax=Nocardioides furvisabuli TaxID=375542 RepID=A0ABP5ID55_9ACTN
MAVDRLAVERPQQERTPVRDDLVERLDASVRERVRREGVDPQREALVVRRIAEDVVRDHDQLSLTGAVAPIADDEAMVGELVARVSGFGPLQPFLDDPEVEEVWINSPERVFIARRGRHELTNLRLDAAQVGELVERMLKSSGRRLDISTPFVDAMLPEGHRLHVVLEGITRGFTAVNIRKFLLRAHRLSDLVALGSLTPQAAAFLEASVRAGMNILVAGGTQAGKTTMLNCLAAAVPGGERVVSAEEVFELSNMSRIQTCAPSSIPDKALIGPERERLSRASSRTASASPNSAAGPSWSSTPTTTSQQRERRSAPASRPSCLPSRRTVRPSLSRGLSIA